MTQALHRLWSQVVVRPCMPLQYSHHLASNAETHQSYTTCFKSSYKICRQFEIGEMHIFLQRRSATFVALSVLVYFKSPNPLLKLYQTKIYRLYELRYIYSSVSAKCFVALSRMLLASRSRWRRDCAALRRKRLRYWTKKSCPYWELCRGDLPSHQYRSHPGQTNDTR